MKAMVVNRVGDFALTIGLALLFVGCRSLDFGIVFASFNLFAQTRSYGLLIDLVCLFLFIGAVGKSAQIGLHTWLPDAMEGPSPVSALIHAATMVTAGIFLIIRSSNLFAHSTNIATVMAIVGVATAFFAASVGLVQFDIKKTVAYSTCSQLGYMMFANGMMQYSTSLFHLFNHAFFKALLFLAAGSIIHSMGNQQDMRKMGGLMQILPFFYVIISIASLALAGFLFYAGFYSKDLILETSIMTYRVEGLFLYWLGTLTAIFTATYSTNLIANVFVEETNAARPTLAALHSAAGIEIFALSFLAMGSLFSGYCCKDLFIGLGTDFFKQSLVLAPVNVYTAAEFLPLWLKLLPTVLSLSVVWILVKDADDWLDLRLYNVFHFLSNKWYFNTLQNHFVGMPTLRAGYLTF